MTTRVIQRTPNIGMALKLRRPQDPCRCTLLGAGWATSPVRFSGFFEVTEATQELQTDEFGIVTGGYDKPEEVHATGILLNSLPAGGENAPFYYVMAYPVGPESSGVQWTWSSTRNFTVPAVDSGGQFWGGFDIRQVGPLLDVFILPGAVGSSDDGGIPVVNLIATATCPDGSSADVRLEINVAADLGPGGGGIIGP